MAAATPGDGSLLKVSISASFTTIAKQIKFGPVNQKRGKIEYTGLADTAEVFVAATIKRFDEIAFSGYWDPADTSHAYLQTSMSGGLTEAWKITYADTGACDITFSGFLTSLEYGEVTIDGLVPVSGSIQITAGSGFTVTP